MQLTGLAGFRSLAKGNSQSLAYLQLHISVFLWGFTAILGKLISLHHLNLVWWRVLVSSLLMLLLFKPVRKMLPTLNRKTLWKLSYIGVLVSVHWFFFYGSIKHSNASLALICLSTTSFMTAFLEPLITGRRFVWVETVLGVAIVGGIAYIAATQEVSAIGIVFGLLAAFFAGWFTVLNKTIVEGSDARVITFVELAAGWLFLCLLFPVYQYIEPVRLSLPTGNDIGYMLLLTIGCTILPFILSLRALRHIPAFASVLTVNLEPVYGILLAIWLLKEDKELDTRFYIGATVVLLCVFAYPFLQKRYLGGKSIPPLQG